MFEAKLKIKILPFSPLKLFNKNIYITFGQYEYGRKSDFFLDFCTSNEHILIKEKIQVGLTGKCEFLLQPAWHGRRTNPNCRVARVSRFADSQPAGGGRTEERERTSRTSATHRLRAAGRAPAAACTRPTQQHMRDPSSRSSTLITPRRDKQKQR